ncbi:ATP-binding cassette domain-containing protein [Sinomonas sp. ASV322]|uniref:ATP-binding cassette domain-containing protein n=1 Tax=Sinomonas sp. ASV322 TaxID=3041920 RepID=UPI0027DEA551|nr:ATP-binding cassette domain-containing protein [Sinomonas sp. ASV322]MDQ4501619.1 ATP-binding cassette domain-containing protein [Sinomonas sp. ASV322]
MRDELKREPVVLLHDVSHGFKPDQWLFEGLTATFSSGVVTGISGPSGSGKSTLLSIIARWEKPRRGRVVVARGTTTRWVFQNPFGVPRRTALDHVALAFLAHGLDRASATREAAALLGDFGLAGNVDMPFSALSGGEAQRLMLARAVAGHPDLILVDEPTAQLDRANAATVNSVLASLAARGSAVVVASHDGETLAACGAVVDLSARAHAPGPSEAGHAHP